LVLISDNSGFLQRVQVKFHFDSAGGFALMLAGMAIARGPNAAAAKRVHKISLGHRMLAGE
jgi:hypothetical protein